MQTKGKCTPKSNFSKAYNKHYGIYILYTMKKVVSSWKLISFYFNIKLVSFSCSVLKIDFLFTKFWLFCFMKTHRTRFHYLLEVFIFSFRWKDSELENFIIYVNSFHMKWCLIMKWLHQNHFLKSSYLAQRYLKLLWNYLYLLELRTGVI